jgi:hypothetical protein
MEVSGLVYVPIASTPMKIVLSTYWMTEIVGANVGL